jgi:hypothetical protein
VSWLFLTAVTLLAMEQLDNRKFCFKMGKTPTETYPYGMHPAVCHTIALIVPSTQQ